MVIETEFEPRYALLLLGNKFKINIELMLSSCGSAQ